MLFLFCSSVEASLSAKMSERRQSRNGSCFARRRCSVSNVWPGPLNPRRSMVQKALLGPFLNDSGSTFCKFAKKRVLGSTTCLETAWGSAPCLNVRGLRFRPLASATSPRAGQNDLGFGPRVWHGLEALNSGAYNVS